MMVNQRSESGHLSVELNDSKNLASISVLRRDNLPIELRKLGEIEAYRRIDEFFSREGERFELMEVLGIHDDDVLEQFVRLGFTPRTAPAIEMVPVVFVAWASGEVTDYECAESVSAIHESELAEFPKTWSVVQTWLDVRPGQGLWDAWVNYMRCRLEPMSEVQKAGLHQRLKNQARLVARASGGWLGIGSVCPEEQIIMDAIDNVFLGAAVRSDGPEVLLR